MTHPTYPQCQTLLPRDMSLGVHINFVDAQVGGVHHHRNSHNTIQSDITNSHNDSSISTHHGKHDQYFDNIRLTSPRSRVAHHRSLSTRTHPLKWGLGVDAVSDATWYHEGPFEESEHATEFQSAHDTHPPTSRMPESSPPPFTFAASSQPSTSTETPHRFKSNNPFIRLVQECHKCEHDREQPREGLCPTCGSLMVQARDHTELSADLNTIGRPGSPRTSVLYSPYSPPNHPFYVSPLTPFWHSPYTNYSMLPMMQSHPHPLQYVQLPSPCCQYLGYLRSHVTVA